MTKSDKYSPEARYCHVDTLLSNNINVHALLRMYPLVGAVDQNTLGWPFPNLRHVEGLPQQQVTDVSFFLLPQQMLQNDEQQSTITYA